MIPDDRVEALAYRFRWFVLAWLVFSFGSYWYRVAGIARRAAAVDRVLAWFS